MYGNIIEHPEGLTSQVAFSTPHGTVVIMGICWTSRHLFPLDEEELQKLAAFQADFDEKQYQKALKSLG